MKHRSPRSRALFGLSALVATVACVSCASTVAPCARQEVAKAPPAPTYFRVDYKIRAEGGLVPRAEVREGVNFNKLKGSWTEGTAAVRLPESCKQEGAAQGTGALAAEGKAIMATNCGFWLAEIERALSKGHYKVVSWNALSQLERTKGVPTHIAARELGADFVLLVNSLDAAPSRLGKAYSESFKYFDSDPSGKKGAPREIADAERHRLKEFVQSRTNFLRDKDLVTGIKAVLDMTAVDAKTGEAVWFYLKQEARLLQSGLDRHFLFAEYADDQWWPLVPKWLQVTPAASATATTHRSSSDESGVVESAAPEDAYAAEVRELVRNVVDDFMHRFRGEPG